MWVCDENCVLFVSCSDPSLLHCPQSELAHTTLCIEPCVIGQTLLTCLCMKTGCWGATGRGCEKTSLQLFQQKRSSQIKLDDGQRTYTRRLDNSYLVFAWRRQHRDTGRFPWMCGPREWVSPGWPWWLWLGGNTPQKDSVRARSCNVCLKRWQWQIYKIVLFLNRNTRSSSSIIKWK